MSYSLKYKNWILLQNCLYEKGVIYTYHDSDRMDGYIYKKDIIDGEEKFHIHSYRQKNEKKVVFTQLKAKSSNIRNRREPDLATMEMNDWVDACHEMDPSVIFTVRVLKECFEALEAQGPG